MGIFKRGNIWWIRYSYKGKIQRESSESTNKTVAKQLLSIRKAEIAQGKLQKKLLASWTTPFNAPAVGSLWEGRERRREESMGNS